MADSYIVYGVDPMAISYRVSHSGFFGRSYRVPYSGVDSTANAPQLTGTIFSVPYGNINCTRASNAATALLWSTCTPQQTINYLVDPMANSYGVPHSKQLLSGPYGRKLRSSTPKQTDTPLSYSPCWRSKMQ